MSLPPAPAHPGRLAFLGTPAASVVPLRALVDAGHEVALVVSQPDRRRGRGGRTSPSPVKQAALDLGLPVTDRVDDVLDAGVDLGVVVAFGRLIKPHVLAELPMVNLHFSLLPRWRGAAPVERAVLAGDDRTGVDLMVVEEGLDTGGIYDRAEVAIGPDETADELRERLARLGAGLLVDNLARGLGEPRPQVGEPTYAHKIAPDDLALDWSAPAAHIHRVVRVGGAWTTHRGARLKVWRTALAPGGRDAIEVPAGDGAIWLVEVQPEGRRRMPARAWVNGVGGDVTAGLGR
ncbi:MAG TPA: methionyl-tRNA formyltransferase [Acidimicrobiales bacterium]|nr:methionyl-tRNA formyltransferase [Acidimicrobiales bacterium]